MCMMHKIGHVTRVQWLWAGLNATDVVAALTAAHAAGHATFGLDVTTGEPRDLAQDDITDLHSSKWCASPPSLTPTAPNRALISPEKTLCYLTSCHQHPSYVISWYQYEPN